MTEHAKLSASRSHRWMLCPGSIKAEECLAEVDNIYAAEGRLAHELAESILESVLTGKEFEQPVKISSEMRDAVDKYIAYIANLKCLPEYTYIRTKEFYEQKVDFSHIVPGGFGTADAIIYSSVNSCLHIIDFKYGLGNRIEAKDNSQMLLYALGALNFLKKEEIIEIQMHIVQPRIDHYDCASISVGELFQWGGYIKAKAELALDPNAKRIPSEIACKYCKANSTCPALNDITTQVAELTTKDKLTTDETRVILDNSKIIINFINKIEQKVYNQLLTGNEFSGYKLVKGRNMRKIDLQKENLIFEMLGEKAYTKSLIGIGKLEKMVDKTILNELIYTTMSNPLLVKETDRRSALDLEDFKFDAVEE